MMHGIKRGTFLKNIFKERNVLYFYEVFAAWSSNAKRVSRAVSWFHLTNEKHESETEHAETKHAFLAIKDFSQETSLS